MSTTNEATSLRDAIIDVLITAGVDGLDFDDLDDALDEVYPKLRLNGIDESEEMEQLISDGIVEKIGCSWARLARPEWERRVAAVLADAGVRAGAIGLDAVATVVMAVLMPVHTEEAT